jgi:hypothetical protein
MPLGVQSVTVSVPTATAPTDVTVPIGRLDLSTEDGFYITRTERVFHAATPSPTISWASVAGAQNYRVRVRSVQDDQDLFRWQPGNASTTSATEPDGVFRPGRRLGISAPGVVSRGACRKSMRRRYDSRAALVPRLRSRRREGRLHLPAPLLAVPIQIGFELLRCGEQGDVGQ